MADISVITLPSGSSYNLKDAQARQDIANIKTAASGAMHFIGETTTALADGATTSPIMIEEKEYTPNAGDVVAYEKSEFVWSAVANKWIWFGDLGSLKKLAFKDSASGSYTPAGSVSVGVTGTKATIKSSFTPAGSVSGSVTPKGANAASTVSITPTTTSVFQMGSAGSVTAGSKASCSLPVFSTSVTGETLKLAWTAGSFTPNTPTAVTMPTRAEVKNLWNGVKSATAAAQAFTGAPSAISASFTGTAGTATADYTPAVTASGSFTGTKATITVS